MAPTSPTPSAPVEFLPAKRHPMEHLSKLFSSFCNPLDAADDEDDNGGVDTEPENHETRGREILFNPDGAVITSDSKLIATTDTVQGTDDEYELIMHMDATTTTTTTTTAIPTTSSPTSLVDPPLMPIIPEGILKTKSKKKTTAVVVDSGRGHRVHRILETAIFTVLVVVATMVTLRRLGHETDLNFFRSSNPSSFPIKFNFRKKEIVTVPKVESDIELRQDETTQVETDVDAPSQEDTTQVEAKSEVDAPSQEKTAHVETEEAATSQQDTSQERTETEVDAPRQEETTQVATETEEAAPIQEETAQVETQVDVPSQEETTQVETEEAAPIQEETTQVETEGAAPLDDDVAEDMFEDSLSPTSDDAGAADESEANQYKEL